MERLHIVKLICEFAVVGVARNLVHDGVGDVGKRHHLRLVVGDGSEVVAAIVSQGEEGHHSADEIVCAVVSDNVAVFVGERQLLAPLFYKHVACRVFLFQPRVEVGVGEEAYLVVVDRPVAHAVNDVIHRLEIFVMALFAKLEGQRGVQLIGKTRHTTG